MTSAFLHLRAAAGALCAAAVLSFSTIAVLPAVQAAPYQALPDLGTAGVLGLTVQREEQLGEFFMRTARGRMPIIDDPVLNEYLNSVGSKLLLHAQYVNFPFEFFVVNDTSLNASAFLGGKVRVNTGLFIYSDTEDEFASVLAHEITHVTQRHIARFLESQVRVTSMTLASIIGSLAMAIINPSMGMAAASAAMGASAQSRINFTRDNEYEADRIGLDLLYQSGWNPAGMTDLFRKLLSMQGNINPAFTLLIDHPLSEIRIAEAQNRVQQLPQRRNSDNIDFYLAKARVDVRYVQHPDMQEYVESLLADDKANPHYRNYALALAYYELKDYAKAAEYVNKLPVSNLFVIDLLTDIDAAQKHYQSAISRLRTALKRRSTNPALIMNPANVYLEAGQERSCIRLLERYLERRPQDVIALNLISKAYGRSGDQCALLQTRGELFALYANYSKSIYMFNQALNACPQQLTQEKIKARVVQLANQRSFDEQLSRGL